MMLHKFRRAMINLKRENHCEAMWKLMIHGLAVPSASLHSSRQLMGRKAALVLVAVEKRGGLPPARTHAWR